MFKIIKSIDIHFAHVVRGHSGLCLGPHGHTWKFEVCLSAETLDSENFVCDFGAVKKALLQPLHDLLDHGFALGARDHAALHNTFAAFGDYMLSTREDVHGFEKAATLQHGIITAETALMKDAVGGAGFTGVRLQRQGACKVIVFDFVPTSEALAQWTFKQLKTVADQCSGLEKGFTYPRVRAEWARVYETLQPVQSYAEYSE